MLIPTIAEQISLFDRKVERLRLLEGREFVRDLRHLVVQSWLRNTRVYPYVREMVATRQRALSEFEELLLPVRSGLISLKQDLVKERPETADDGAIGQVLASVHQDTFHRISLSKFDELAQAPKVSSGESIPGWNPTDPYLDERTVEGWLLNILSDRISGLWARDKRWTRTGNGRLLNEGFEALKACYWNEVRRYVDCGSSQPLRKPCTSSSSL